MIVKLKCSQNNLVGSPFQTDSYLPSSFLNPNIDFFEIDQVDDLTPDNSKTATKMFVFFFLFSKPEPIFKTKVLEAHEGSLLPEE